MVSCLFLHVHRRPRHLVVPLHALPRVPHAQQLGRHHLRRALAAQAARHVGQEELAGVFAEALHEGPDAGLLADIMKK